MLTNLSGKSIRTAEQALAASGLSWGISENSVYDAAGRPMKGYKALCRSDTGAQLSIVKDTYYPISNDVFGFFDAVCKRQNAEYVAGGSLDGGRRVFLSAKVGRMEIVRGDEVDCHLILLNSFDGSSSLRALICPWRLVCSNQLSRAAKESVTNISIRHTSGIDTRVLEAFRLFNMSMTSFGLFVNKSKLLAHKNINAQQVKLFLDEMVPDSGSTRSKNSRERVVSLFQSGKGNNGRTAWNLVNGFVEHLDWDGDGEKDRLIDSRLFGYRAAQKAKAFDFALTL
jgi:phage/plasmid-like protein (TIGR03299 family)